jgi:hypothetical protein
MVAKEDDSLIKLLFIDRDHRIVLPFDEQTIIPYSKCEVPFNDFPDIPIARRHQFLQQEVDEVPETSEFFEEFTATASLKFWDKYTPYDMTITDVSVDTERGECIIKFSREDYERFSKRQRT